MSSPTLSDFSSCEISDALIKLNIPSGGYIPDITMHSPSPASQSSTMRLCGQAYTVEMVHASNKFAPTLSEHFVDTITPGSVVVINAPPRAVPLSSLNPTYIHSPLTHSWFTDVKNAVWGGLMTAGAQARKALGVVISGRCRDLLEHREAGFPVFARGHSTVGQSPFTRPSAVNVPLTIGDVSGAFPATTVNPGDWIVADEDGVVCVPQEMLEQVLALAEKGRVVDALCMQDIREGKGVQATFKQYRGK